ncbi:MAG TPA: hypothetical protein VGD40_05840 [Chryseosolibacter sp.]
MQTLYFTLLQVRGWRSGGEYSTPYDSTQGVPSIVFIGFWVLILLFGIRLAWEYRDKIFPKNETRRKSSVKPSNKRNER